MRSSTPKVWVRQVLRSCQVQEVLLHHLSSLSQLIKGNTSCHTVPSGVCVICSLPPAASWKSSPGADKAAPDSLGSGWQVPAGSWCQVFVLWVEESGPGEGVREGDGGGRWPRSGTGSWFSGAPGVSGTVRGRRRACPHLRVQGGPGSPNPGVLVLAPGLVERGQILCPEAGDIIPVSSRESATFPLSSRTPHVLVSARARGAACGERIPVEP